MATNSNDIEKRLWDAADQLRANSQLSSNEYSAPVLGLIFLRYADFKFGFVHEELNKNNSTGRLVITKEDYQAQGVLYLPEEARYSYQEARYSYLLNLPEEANVGKAINDAMKSIEEESKRLPAGSR